MKRKTETDRYSTWMDRISDREKYLDTLSTEWNKYLRFLRQELNPDESPDGDSVWINYQFGFSRVILPSIYYRNPDILVKPRKDTPYATAQLRERLLNFELQEIGFEKEMRRIILDTLFCGTGFMKFGFHSFEEKPKRSTRSMSTDDLLQELFEGTSEEGIEPDTDQKSGYDSRISSVFPYAIRVSPKRMFVDKYAPTLEEARWVVHKVFKPVDEVKDSSRYSKRLTSGLEPTHDGSSVDDGYNYVEPAYDRQKGASSKDGLVCLYEIYDKETDQLLVMDSYNMERNNGKFLRVEDNPYPFPLPIDALIFNQDPERFYGISDAMTWYNPANALNLVNSMHYNHVKRFARKYAAEHGSVDQAQMDNFIAARDGAVVWTHGNPNDTIVPIKDAPMSADNYTLRDTLRGELVFLTGVTEQRKGGAEQAKTATEASIIEQQAKVRDSDRLYLVSKFVERSVYKLDELNKMYLPKDFVAFLEGPDAEWWSANSDKALNTDVDIRIRVGSSSFISREVRTKQLLDFLNLTKGLTELDPMTGQPRPLVNARAVIERIADSLDIDRFEELLTSGSAPPEQAPPQLAEGNNPSAAGNPLRNGSPNLGAMLSGVQNLGVRRTPPNPTMGE